MCSIELLVQNYLTAERDLAAAVDAAGGAIALPDGRTVTTARAEFDSALTGRRKRVWLILEKMRPCRRGDNLSSSAAHPALCRRRRSYQKHHRGYVEPKVDTWL